MEPHPTKLMILSFGDAKMNTPKSFFILPVNPEKYVQQFSVKYDVKVAKGGQGVEEKFMSSAPEELKLDFTLDGTGTIYNYAYPIDNVPIQIQHLKEVVYDLSGDIHQPRFLKIIGMGIIFPCILKDLKLTYTLFSPVGLPLRAKVSATFLNFKETKRRVIEEGKNSPDLTHIRMVKDGNTLPLMVNDIYKDPKHYLEVARANNLTNFRKLQTGQQIIFPPVAKTDT